MDVIKKFGILIVDDEKTNLDVLSHILNEHYTVYIAKSGEAALNKAAENKPDLVLLDVVMPEMDGFEVISRLKSDQALCEIPVIFITGLSNPANEEKGLRLGAVDYITKPFNPAVVLSRVRSQLKIIEQIRTIEELGMIDPLTGIANRKRFETLFRIEWRRSVREATSLCLMLLEADRFDLFVEAHGFAEGNTLLRDIAGVLESTVKRPTDLVARLDSERFGICLPGTDREGGILLAEAIRSGVESHRAAVNIGIAATVPKRNEAPDDFVAAAERLLSQARPSHGAIPS